MESNIDNRKGGLQAVMAILVATVLLHLVGTATLFGIVSGPLAVLATPLLALFGLFLLPVELGVVAAQWYLVQPVESIRRLAAVWATTVLPAVGLMILLGPKEESHELTWTLGYAVATTVAATISLLIVGLFKESRG